MKRKLSLLLAMVLAMTMVMGIGVTAFADDYITEVTFTVAPFDFDNPSTFPAITATADGMDSMPYFLIYFDSNGELCFIYSPLGETYFTPDLEEELPTPPDFSNVEYAFADLLCVQDGKLFDESTTYVGLNEILESNFAIPGEPFTIPAGANMNDYTGYLYGGSQVSVQVAYKKGNGSNPDSPQSSGSSTSAHTHNFQWQTITEPTKDTDGLEGEVCSCGATRNTQKLSAYGYALNQYATPMINAAKAGQTITFELGEWNSFPKSFMEKIATKSMEGVTFVFHYKWNHVKQEITIPFGTAVDTQFDWYGPAKMAELYGAN